MAQEAIARLLIVAEVKNLLSAAMRQMGVDADTLTADIAEQDAAVGRLGEAYRLVDALGGAFSASTLDVGRSMGSLASGVREANQALDAFGDYEKLVAAEAEGGVRSVREFLVSLEALGAEVTRIKAQGPPTFKIGAATAGTDQEQLARQFAAAKTLFGRDLAAEERALRERIAAEQILDPLLRKRLEDEAALAASIREATVAEREQVEAFMRGEQEIARAIRSATDAEKAQVAEFVRGAQQKQALLARFAATFSAGATENPAIASMEADAANAFTAALQRGAAAEEQFRKAITDATSAETAQLERTSELARVLRGGQWQAAIDHTRQLEAATRELGAEYARAALSAQRFFERQVRGGVAPGVAAGQAQAQFAGDLAVFKAVSNPNTSGFQKFRAEIAAGAIGLRNLIGESKILSTQFERLNQIAGSTASTLILFFVVVNRIREATNQAIEFSRAMTQVATITDLTGREVAQLGDQVQDLALSFGLKEIDVARGLYFTLSSGIENTADALKLVTAANELAVTGFATVEQTIDLLTSTINAYGLTVDDARRLNDLFFQTVRVGKAELPELAHNLGSVLPIAAQMGVSLEELTGAVAALTLGGQNADESVTSLRQLFVNFLNPTSEAQQILSELQTQTDKLGDSTLAAAIKSKGMLTVMQGLAETVGNNAARFRELVPDARGFVALSALAGNQLGQFERTLDATTNAAGANAEALKKVLTSQAKQIEIIQGGIRQGFLDIGKSIIDGFAPLDGTAEGAQAAAESIRTSIASITPVVQDVIVAFQLLGAGVVALGTIPTNFKAIDKTLELDQYERSIVSLREGLNDALRDGDEGLIAIYKRDIAYVSERLKALRVEQARASGEAERRNQLLQTLASFDPADFDALSRGQKKAAQTADEYADKVRKLNSELISARVYLNGFADSARDGDAYRDAARHVDELSDRLSKLVAKGTYSAALAGNADFGKLVSDRTNKALAAEEAARARVLRQRNIDLGAPTEDIDANANAAAAAAAEYERLAQSATFVEKALRDIKNVNIREEFESNARLAARFGTETEKSLATAREKVLELARAFRADQFEILSRLNKGDFGAASSDAAALEAGKQLNARRALFEAETEAAQREVRLAEYQIRVQGALGAAYTNTDAAIATMTEAMRGGDIVLAGLTASFVAAARNAPDFAEAVKSTEYLKEITGKLKLSKLQEAEAEVQAVVAIRGRFDADVDAGRITGKRAQQIRELIERLYAQADAEREVLRAQAEKRTPTQFNILSAITTAAEASAIGIQQFVKAGAAEKALKEDLELLDQRRVTTLTQEAQALNQRLIAIQASIPFYEGIHALNAQEADQMREKIALIRETTLAELEKRAAVEERERFLKTQGFGGGFAQAFDEMTRTIDESFERGQIIGQSFFSNLENGFASVVSGATSAKEAFRQFAQAMLADISRLLVRMLLMETLGKSLGSFLGFGGGAPIGSPSGAGAIFPGVPSAKGNVFEYGNIRQFKKGGFPDIGNEPALFRTRDGRLNSMREGGKPEAIVPLERGPGGELGVQAFGLPPTPLVQDINVTARPDAASFAAQAKALFAAQRSFEREIDRIGSSVRPGARSFTPAARPIPVEFSGRGAVGSARAGQTVNLRMELHMQSLDPSRAADVVLTAMPQIQRAFTNVLRRGTDAELNAEIRTVAGRQ